MFKIKCLTLDTRLVPCVHIDFYGLRSVFLFANYLVEMISTFGMFWSIGALKW